MTRFLPAFVLLLAACGGPDPVAACEAYLAAEGACAAEAFGSGTADGSAVAGGLSCESLYGEVKGNAAKAADSAFACYAETLDVADCSSPEAYFAAQDAICTCEDAIAGQCDQADAR